MTWVETVAVAADIFKAESDRARAKNDAAAAKIVLDKVADALESISDEARQFLTKHSHQALAGWFAAELAAAVRYARDPIDKSVIEAAIRGLRGIFEETSEYAADTANAEALAFDTFAPCAVSASAAAVLMTDARYRYDSKGTMAGLLSRMLTLASRIEGVLRRRSDSRFRIAFQNAEPGFVEVGYIFDGTFELVAIIPSNGNPATARQKALEEMAKRQDQVFGDFPGVREVRRILAEVASESDSPEPTLVPVRGEGLADVVLDQQAGPPFRFRLA